MPSTITTAIVTAGSNSHATTSYEANAYATDFVTQGVVGAITSPGGSSASTGAFAVTQDASPDMGVTVLLGNAYVTGTPSGQASQTLRCYMTTNYTSYTINANASGSTKYDWIYLSFSAGDAANPSAGADNVITLFTSRSTSNTSDTGSPPTYGLLLAVVTVANGASTISNANISDKRAQTTLSLTSTTNTGGWTPTSLPFGTVTYNGNHSYSCTFTGTDLTGIISKGMRLLMTRTVAAPTQCTSLNGTTQYWSKSSPAGMTFTDDFTVSAWIKLTSYATTSTIVSRYNGTSGWAFYINTDGTIQLLGLNGGAGNNSYIKSYQSVPLNKWVHVSANLDMSAYSTNTDGGATGSCITLDGINIPSFVGRQGTNPTSLVQAGNLEVGSQNGGGSPFSGKLAQVAIFNTKITNATMLTYISQGLAGTETSLISAYSFNNSFNDLNANANNLTANGSATATNADSPFAQAATAGTLEYGIVTSASFSTNTTLTVQVPEGSAIPTSGGVSAVSYSTQKVPYGFPAEKLKWNIEMLQRANGSQSSPSANTWYNIGVALTVPIGSWTVDYQVLAKVVNNTNVPSIYSTLSTANNSQSDADFSSEARWTSANANGYQSYLARSKDLTLGSQTPYYLNAQTDQASASSLTFQAADGTTTIRAAIAYL